MRFSLLANILVILCINSVYAEIYTCKDADGKTIYTDSPGSCSNAEEVEVDALPTLIPTKPLTNRPTINSRNTQQEDKNKYTVLKITSPANDSTLRENQGNVTISFQVTPGLQARNGDKFVVTVDGAEVYSGTSTITTLKNVDRGTHTIGVKVVDAKGKAKISASPVKFTLQRFSALQNSANTQNNSSDNSGGDGDNGAPTINQDGFKFPGSTQLPTRPPPPPPSN